MLAGLELELVGQVRWHGKANCDRVFGFLKNLSNGKLMEH
ncbi:hypothetical protein SC1_04319 [Sphingopyxis sp. C-1]|nr:hypothetical protein SC1_04319 [Sphingopyxis sp. C-1]